MVGLALAFLWKVLGNRLEHVFDILGRFGRRFHEQHAVVFGIVLGLLRPDPALRLKVGLIAHQCYDHLGQALRLQLLDPCLGPVQGTLHG